MGARVREARREVGLTGEELGRLVGLSKFQISNIEREERRISVAEMPMIAAALRVTPQWLLGLRQPAALAFAHRLNGAGDNAPAQERAAAILNVEELLKNVDAIAPPRTSAAGRQILAEVRTRFTDEPRTRAEAQRQGRAMAELVRENLRLGNNEIANLPDLIEMHFAADVALSPMGVQADGLCAHNDDRAVIVASSSFDAGHVRFTLAHELGHHLLADPRDVIDELDVNPGASGLSERRVSAFAAHLLLPMDGIDEALGWLGLSGADFDGVTFRAVRGAAKIADKFALSTPALVYQLADRGLIADIDAWIDAIDPVRRGSQPGSAQGAVRAPTRILEAALDAALMKKTGTGPLAVLLERQDEDVLFAEYLSAAID